MHQTYNFEQHTPPKITEKMLQAEIRRRTLQRQIRLLRIASLLSCLFFTLFAFFILPDSVAVSIASLIILAYMLIGNGLITVVFYQKGMSYQ